MVFVPHHLAYFHSLLLQKTVVHLDNRILCSREKEGAYTLCNRELVPFKITQMYVVALPEVQVARPLHDICVFM